MFVFVNIFCVICHIKLTVMSSLEIFPFVKNKWIAGPFNDFYVSGLFDINLEFLLSVCVGSYTLGCAFHWSGVSGVLYNM